MFLNSRLWHQHLIFKWITLNIITFWKSISFSEYNDTVYLIFVKTLCIFFDINLDVFQSIFQISTMNYHCFQKMLIRILSNVWYLEISRVIKKLEKKLTQPSKLTRLFLLNSSCYLLLEIGGNLLYNLLKHWHFLFFYSENIIRLLASNNKWNQ